MSGSAFAVDKFDKDEITIITGTGGPITVTGPAEGQTQTETSIPLTVPSFTQRAGEVVEITGTVQFTDPGPCDLVVGLASDGKGAIGVEAPGNAGFDEALLPAAGLPAASADVTHALTGKAIVLSQERPDCDTDQAITVSLRYSIVIMRN